MTEIMVAKVMLINFLLKVLGNGSEFQRISNLLAVSLNFNVDINVSVFETNIRGELPFCSSTMLA